MGFLKHTGNLNTQDQELQDQGKAKPWICLSEILAIIHVLWIAEVEYVVF